MLVYCNGCLFDQNRNQTQYISQGMAKSKSLIGVILASSLNFQIMSNIFE